MRKFAEIVQRVSIRSSIYVLNNFVRDSKKGLPLEVFYFISSMTPLINVDLLIQDEDTDATKTLLVWRQDDFYKGWHLPGGIIRFKENIEDRIRHVARIEVRSEVARIGTLLEVNQKINDIRDVRGHFISLLFPVTIILLSDKYQDFDKTEFVSHGDCRWHVRPPDNLISQHDIYRKFF